jgi:uncharacterized protein (UPF0261 family)
LEEMNMAKTIAVVATLDTKGVEAGFIRERVEAAGLSALVIDTGVLAKPAFLGDIPRETVAEAAGTSLVRLVSEKDRGKSVTAMAEGAAKVVRGLFDAGKIHGVISIGGSAGTTIGTSAMRALPVGFPKVMVSTLASGDTRPYVGIKDITMMYSVVDIAGLNRLSRRILANAAAAVCAMAQAELPPAAEERPLLAATMFGVTTPCVTRAREILEENGFEVLVFHATGTGGRAMEDLIESGFIAGVLDITTTEWADELVGGVLSAGPHRLEAAGKKGIPQVVAPGALDMVNFGPPETVPEKFKGRKFYQHNPTVTLMRTTKEENAQLGRIIAEKLNAAKGPTTFFYPRKGVSGIDREGQPFYDPEADEAFIASLKASLNASVRLIEMDNHINDEAFAAAVAHSLMETLARA